MVLRFPGVPPRRALQRRTEWLLEWEEVQEKRHDDKVVGVESHIGHAAVIGEQQLPLMESAEQLADELGLLVRSINQDKKGQQNPTCTHLGQVRSI